VGVSPLTLCAAGPWPAGRGLRSGCLAAWGCGPGLGWSGRPSGWPGGFCPQVEPGLLAVVAFGQVKDEVAAAVARGTGGHGDEVAADGGGAGLRIAGAGAGPRRRSRLKAMAARTSQAACALKTPDGRRARGPEFRSAMTCSTTAWSRCCPSAGVFRTGSR